MPYTIYHFRSLASTQGKAKKISKKGLSDIAIVADMQTKGRGRFKRKWHSGKGGLWMSILLRPGNTQNLQYLTFAAAVSVVKSIENIAKLKSNIKWPNDVHYKNKKLCGILTEGTFGKDSYVIVGIGLNVNQSKFPDDVKNLAISLKMAKKKTFSIKKLEDNVLEEFFKLYNNCYNKNKLNRILAIWKRYCDTINRNVTVITKTKEINGKVTGVDEECRLLLKTKNSRIIKIIEGDIRVRY